MKKMHLLSNEARHTLRGMTIGFILGFLLAVVWLSQYVGAA